MPRHKPKPDKEKDAHYKGRTALNNALLANDMTFEGGAPALPRTRPAKAPTISQMKRIVARGKK